MGAFSANLPISFFEHAILNEHLLFQNGSVLMSIDIEDYRTEYVLNDDLWLKSHNADQMLSQGNYLYMLSRAENEIARLDIMTGKCDVLYTCKGGLGYIHTFRLHEGNLYVIYKSGLIVCLLPDGTRKEYVDSNIKECRTVLNGDKDDELYLLDKRCPYITCFKVGSDEFKRKKLPFVPTLKDSVSVSDHKLYVIHDKELTICNLIDSGYEQYEIITNESSIEKSYPVVLKNVMYLLPTFGDKIMCLRLLSKELEALDAYPMDYKQTCTEYFAKNGSKYCGYKRCKGRLYFPCRISDYMMIIDENTEKIEWKKIEMPPIEQTLEFAMNTSGMIYENTEMNLNAFLNVLRK